MLLKRVPIASRRASRTTIPAWLAVFLHGLFNVADFLALLRMGSRYRKILFVSNPPFVTFIAPFSGKPYALLIYDLYPYVVRHLETENVF